MILTLKQGTAQFYRNILYTMAAYNRKYKKYITLYGLVWLVTADTVKKERVVYD